MNLMHLLTIFLCIPFMGNASFAKDNPTLKPSLGIYTCTHNIPEGICDQRMERVFGFEIDGKLELSALQLSYVGDCGDQGPYLYYCENNECSDYNSVKIKVISETEYEWENFLYGFYCKMKKVPAPLKGSNSHTHSTQIF